MSDDELLKLAARAAGDEFVWRHRGIIWLCWSGAPRKSLDKPWSPLTDDGDALRLAVKLGIEIGDWHQYKRGFAYNRRTGAEFWEEGRGDPCADTRRAIVRAAAAIAGEQP